MGTNWIRQMRRIVGLVWVALLVALLGLVGISHLAPHTGNQVFIIRGASMTPAIPLGSLVAARAVPADQIAVGDVITIKGSNGTVYTHRVVAIDHSTGETRFQLKGDANDSPDGGLTPASTVIGRADLHVPIAGYLLGMLSMPSGMLSVMSMLASLLLCYWLLEDIEHDLASDDEPQPTPTPAPAPA